VVGWCVRRIACHVHERTHSKRATTTTMKMVNVKCETIKMKQQQQQQIFTSNINSEQR